MKNLIVLAMSAVLLFSCQEKKSSSSIPMLSIGKTTLVKGNPDEFVSGMQLNKESPLTEEMARDFENNYTLADYNQITEKVEIIKETSDGKEIEKEMAPPEKEQYETERLNIKMNRDENSQWLMKILGGDTVLRFQKDSSGNLQPTSFIEKNELSTVDVLHWSMKPDKSVISLLIRINLKESGKILLALYFETKTPPQESRKVDPRFFYIEGPGVAIGWKGPEVEIELCGISDFKKTAQYALSKWNSALQNRLNIKILTPETYPPFSDVNHNCFYFIKAYKNVTKTNIHSGGETNSIISPRKKEIISSSIFLFESEYADLREYSKNQSTRSQGGVAEFEMDATLSIVFSQTITHEMGHFLGLDHQFTGISSIMSYTDDCFNLSDYDKEAIQALYPLQRPE